MYEYIKEKQASISIAKKLCLFGVVSILIGIVCYYYYRDKPENRASFLKKIQQLPIDISFIFILLSAGGGFFLLRYIVAYTDIYAGVYELSKVAISFLIFFFLAIMLILQYERLSVGIRQYGKKFLSMMGRQSVTYRLYQAVSKLYHELPFGLVFLLLSVAFLVVVSLGNRIIGLNVGYILILFTCFILFLIMLYIQRKIFEKNQRLLEKTAQMLLEHQEEVSAKEGYAAAEENLAHLAQILDETKASSRQSETLKAELLTNVSHDLRTPLTSLITYSELLKKKEVSTENHEKYVQIINNKAYRMKNLIDDLFEVTKMDNGEIVLEKSDIDLNQLLEQGIAEYEEPLKEKGLKLMYYRPKEEIKGRVDGDKIWRVIDNLFGNAIKYSMMNTRVHLKLWQDEAQIYIEMKNIANYELNENAQSLVERFARADASRNTEGFGLGLAIANSIVALHQGIMEVRVDGDMFKVRISLPKK